MTIASSDRSHSDRAVGVRDPRPGASTAKRRTDTRTKCGNRGKLRGAPAKQLDDAGRTARERTDLPGRGREAE
jgi:hypothetical protein